MKKIILALIFVAICPVANATPSIANWQITTPELLGDITGTFTFPDTATSLNDPAAGDSSKRLATTEWVNAAIAASSGGSSSTTTEYCALTGCTFSANGASVEITPWDYQGYSALAIGGAFTFSGNNQNVGVLYTDAGSGTDPGIEIKGGSLYVDNYLVMYNTYTYSSSTAACPAKSLSVDTTYLYYCIASGNIGRIAWVTGW